MWAKKENIIFYTADYNGVWNLFLHTLDTSATKPYPITNVLTGLQQPTISEDNSMIIFAGYANIGWDLYSISNPLDLKEKSIEPTQFIKNKKLENYDIVDLREHKSNLKMKQVSIIIGFLLKVMNIRMKHIKKKKV